MTFCFEARAGPYTILVLGDGHPMMFAICSCSKGKSRSIEKAWRLGHDGLSAVASTRRTIAAFFYGVTRESINYLAGAHPQSLRHTPCCTIRLGPIGTVKKTQIGGIFSRVPGLPHLKGERRSDAVLGNSLSGDSDRSRNTRFRRNSRGSD